VSRIAGRRRLPLRDPDLSSRRSVICSEAGIPAPRDVRQTASRGGGDDFVGSGGYRRPNVRPHVLRVPHLIPIWRSFHR
jgi:hypothetical protein